MGARSKAQKYGWLANLESERAREADRYGLLHNWLTNKYQPMMQDYWRRMGPVHQKKAGWEQRMSELGMGVQQQRPGLAQYLSGTHLRPQLGAMPLQKIFSYGAPRGTQSDLRRTIEVPWADPMQGATMTKAVGDPSRMVELGPETLRTLAPMAEIGQKWQEYAPEYRQKMMETSKERGKLRYMENMANHYAKQYRVSAGERAEHLKLASAYSYMYKDYKKKAAKHKAHKFMVAKYIFSALTIAAGGIGGILAGAGTGVGTGLSTALTTATAPTLAQEAITTAAPIAMQAGIGAMGPERWGGGWQGALKGAMTGGLGKLLGSGLGTLGAGIGGTAGTGLNWLGQAIGGHPQGLSGLGQSLGMFPQWSSFADMLPWLAKKGMGYYTGIQRPMAQYEAMLNEQRRRTLGI